MTGPTKRKTRRPGQLALILALCAAVTTAAIATIAGCGGKNNPGGDDRFAMFTLATDVSPKNSGVVSRDPHATTYQNGTEVTLTANPAAGYRFAGWSDKTLDQVTPVTITMTRNTNITANFVSISTPDGYALTTKSDPDVNAGTVRRSPDQTHYPAGTEVTLTAEAKADYTFVGWIGSGAPDSTAQSIIITMDGDRELTAKFLPNVYRLTTGDSPMGSGKITREPDQEIYAHGARVTLKAKAESGYIFARWTDPTVPARDSITITMTGDRVLTALFSLITTDHHTLTVHTNPADGSGGRVERVPDATAYTFGTDVALKAIPAPGYGFMGWTGSLESKNAEDTIRILNDMTVTAQFQRGYILTINMIPAGCGTVTPESGSVIDANTPVTLTVVPASFCSFSNWEVTSAIGSAIIANRNSVTTTITLNTSATINANFKQTGVISGNSFIDSRDGKTYRTVEIGNQTWMAENLNYDTIGSACYDNQEPYCDTYGRLYNWSTVMNLPSTCDLVSCASQVPSKPRGICPSGWHVPDYGEYGIDEWEILVSYVGSSSAGTKLKSENGWNIGSDYIPGTNDYGFSALPGGGGYGGSNSFGGAGVVGFWWSTREIVGRNAQSWNMSSSYVGVGNVGMGSSLPIGSGKTSLHSVRCIKDVGTSYTLTVGRNPVDGGTVTGGGTFSVGTSAPITATANPAYMFTGWTGAGVANPSSANTSVAMTENRAVIANFRLIIPKYMLEVRVTPGNAGTVQPNIGSQRDSGAVVNITATANLGYTFAGWTPTNGIANPNSANTTVTMIQERMEITANFKLNTGDDVIHGTLTDARDNKTYRTVQIGTQTWMAENLNYAGSGGSIGECFKDQPSYCTEYGRLYDWSEVMGLPSTCNTGSCAGQMQKPHRGICPAGWHVPSNAEWEALLGYAGWRVVDNYGTRLKSKTGWYYGLNGTDDFGFSALPGGDGWGGSPQDSIGRYGRWWSTTESTSNGYAYYLMIRGASESYLLSNEKKYLSSLRCIRDD